MCVLFVGVYGMVGGGVEVGFVWVVIWVECYVDVGVDGDVFVLYF